MKFVQLVVWSELVKAISVVTAAIATVVAVAPATTEVSMVPNDASMINNSAFIAVNSTLLNKSSLDNESGFNSPLMPKEMSLRELFPVLMVLFMVPRVEFAVTNSLYMSVACPFEVNRSLCIVSNFEFVLLIFVLIVVRSVCKSDNKLLVVVTKPASATLSLWRSFVFVTRASVLVNIKLLDVLISDTSVANNDTSASNVAKSVIKSLKFLTSTIGNRGPEG
jgi:hypothetical protein